MKRITSLIAILIPLTMSSAVFAQDKVVSAQTSKPVASDTTQSASQTTDAHPRMLHEPGMGRQHQGKCQHGNAGGGKKHGGADQQGKHDRHADVVRRLDRIEERMARMEAMMKVLLRRQY